MATLTCPGCAAVVQQDDLICLRCGANLPRRVPDNDPATPATVMQEYLRRDSAQDSSLGTVTCPRCGSVIGDQALLACPLCHGPLPRLVGSISTVVLRLTFPTGNVDVPAGTSLVLGRDPGESLVAAAFARFDNVSRRHATVTVTDTGTATIRDEYSTNGTYVNGDRVLPGTDIRITHGDSVRLAADVEAEVSLPLHDPGTAFSGNGHRAPH